MRSGFAIRSEAEPGKASRAHCSERVADAHRSSGSGRGLCREGLNDGNDFSGGADGTTPTSATRGLSPHAP